MGILRYLLNSDDGILETTTNKIFKDIHFLPKTYRNIPVKFYKDLFGGMDENVDLIKNIDDNLEYFHEIVRQRFKEILKPVLESLQEKSLIKYRKYTVVVLYYKGGKRQVPIFESCEIGLTLDKINKMLLDAQQYASNQITISLYNPQTKKNEPYNLKDINDVMKYFKYNEYLRHYNKYIKKKYNWEYTYDRIEVVLADNKDYILSELEKIKSELENQKEELNSLKSFANSLLVNTIEKTISKKSANACKKYDEKCRKEKEYLLSYKEIRDLYECGLITDECIIRDIYDCRLKKDFLYHSAIFINYEIKIDEKKQREVDEWKMKF